MSDNRNWDQLYVGGRWVDPAGSDRITVISPVTEEPFGSTPDATTEDVDRAVAAARLAFDEGEWPQLDPTERGAALRRFADIYASRLDEMAELVTGEMGSPISFSHLGQSAGAVGADQPLRRNGG